jgi:DNA/RNA-binding domain of Phe-tRNA-synthetase-like protein
MTEDRAVRSEQGWVAPRVATELPGLGISWVVVDGAPRRSPEPVRRRLRDLSDRFYGSHAVHMRERPIPWAYRVFFRHIGLDPDSTRTPVEQLALDRLRDGAFVSSGLPADAVTIATVETGIALRAFDADRIEGGLCIRDTAPGESLPGQQGELPRGTLAIADERRPLEPLFGAATSSELGVDSTTHRVAIAAIQVKDVPDVAVDEALWLASSAIEAA